MKVNSKYLLICSCLILNSKAAVRFNSGNSPTTSNGGHFSMGFSTIGRGGINGRNFQTNVINGATPLNGGHFQSIPSYGNSRPNLMTIGGSLNRGSPNSPIFTNTNSASSTISIANGKVNLRLGSNTVHSGSPTGLQSQNRHPSYSTISNIKTPTELNTVVNQPSYNRYTPVNNVPPTNYKGLNTILKPQKFNTDAVQPASGYIRGQPLPTKQPFYKYQTELNKNKDLPKSNADYAQHFNNDNKREKPNITYKNSKDVSEVQPKSSSSPTDKIKDHLDKLNKKEELLPHSNADQHPKDFSNKKTKIEHQLQKNITTPGSVAKWVQKKLPTLLVLADFGKQNPKIHDKHHYIMTFIILAAIVIILISIIIFIISRK